MRTENKDYFQELDRHVEQLLTPRFVPSAEEIKLSKPKRPAQRIWLNVLRFGTVAAAIVVGLFIMFEPTNEATAKSSEQTIAEALAALQEAETIRVEFRAKVIEGSDSIEPYTIARDGEVINGVLTILKSEDKEYMRVEWGDEVVQLFDEGNMRYKMWQNGELKYDMERSTFVFELLKLASLGAAKAIIKTTDMSMNIEESGDNILVKAVNEDSSVELGGVFSRKQGELLECEARALDKTGGWQKVLSAKIEYNHPITVEQITATPK